MKARSLFLLLVLVAVGAFAILNWGVFTTSSKLSLGYTDIQAPIGLVMLGVLAFVTALFLVFMLLVQASALFDARRHARALQAHRELADQAEASRFTDLREYLAVELKRQATLDGESRAAILARLDQLERDLKSALDQSGTTLTAYIGELEDRLERGGHSLTPRSPT
jgi:uncharacterized integral membrane protein